MAEGAVTLSYAARPRVVAKYLGQLLLMLALLKLPPLVVALMHGEPVFAWRCLAVIGVLLALGLPTLRLAAPARVQINEALAVVALVFLIDPLLMSFPLAGDRLTAVDALFEAVSAVTTTGLTTVRGLHDASHAFLFTRAWMQWYGGLGIVVLSVALLSGHQMATRRLVDASAGEGIVTTSRAHARRMLAVYLVLTAAGILLLWLLLGDVENAVLHALAAVSTGGFAPADASLGALPGWDARFAVIALALCGAVPLPLYLLARQRGIVAILRDPELRLLIVACLTVGLILAAVFHANGMGWREALPQGLLHGVSAQTTAGFSAIDAAAVGDTAMLVMIFAMLAGGGLGSTAGGIKLLRLLILLRLVQFTLRRTALPEHAVAQPTLGGRSLAPDDVQRALLLVMLFVSMALLSWLAFVAAGQPPLASLFEVVSALGTVGLSSGISAQALPAGLKLLLCADMLLGRLEIIALLVVLYPKTWIGRRAELL
ncbi:MAG: potassium transporter TrkG [Chromatiales bacterium]|jgi:trk system potassium uptake protein TrkH|nr:potassium transporter TrkG [Chromatiales bacterium]MDX9766047.1 potassium transporter TrkG [Ectothiorhodospiraceae bacterium]